MKALIGFFAQKTEQIFIFIDIRVDNPLFQLAQFMENCLRKNKRTLLV